MTTLPATLGEFEILHALKAGGMGEVLLARRRGLGGFEQLCAIKTIRPELATAPLVRTMFLDEARLLARLTHPAIAQILDFGEQGGVAYMVMEYVAGEHFRRFAERKPPPTIVCQALAAACRGLHAAHELRDLGDGHLLGVVHRDISPDNLMLGFDGRVKVLDFGIALVRGRQAPATEFGVLKGKPPYMSPEQLRNQELDRRADVFSVAVVLHELLTGEHLFTGDSIYAVVHAVEHQDIQPPSAKAGPLPPDLDDLVMSGLERDRDRRLRSAAAMAEVLERIAAQSGGESLESWAERELADDRDSHRRWMSRVVTGAVAAQVGRPTGVVTALADRPRTDATDATDAHAATGLTDVEPAHDDAVGATMLAEVSSVGPSTAASPGAPVAAPPREFTASPPTMTTGMVAPARRRSLLAFAALVLVAALGALVLVLVAGRRDHAVVTPAMDAAVPVPVDLDAGPGPRPVDAAVVLEVPVDARRPVDAGERPRAVIDAAVGMRPDARGAAPPVAAATVTGQGYLSGNVHASDPAADVRIDGVSKGSTPFAKLPLAAGTHTVVFTDPVSGEEIYRRTVEIGPGQAVTVLAPPRGSP